MIGFSWQGTNKLFQRVEGRAVHIAIDFPRYDSTVQSSILWVILTALRNCIILNDTPVHDHFWMHVGVSMLFDLLALPDATVWHKPVGLSSGQVLIRAVDSFYIHTPSIWWFSASSSTQL